MPRLRPDQCKAQLQRGDPSPRHREVTIRQVGLIGSSAKWSRFRYRLQAEGHAGAVIERITCPIGLPDIAGKAPAVIAISVAARLLQLLQDSVPSVEAVGRG